MSAQPRGAFESCVLACLVIAACSDPRPAAIDQPAPRPAVAEDPTAACVLRAGPLPPEDAAVVRAACAEQRARRIPGFVVAIAERGVLRLAFGHGVRCSGRLGDVTAATGFRIGSLTKSMTAATAFALAGRGVVDLDGAIGASALRALGQDDALARATLRQLLDHRAGLVDILPDASLRGRPVAEQLAALVGEPAFPPGVRWHYANGGYALVGALLTHATAVPWQTLVQREVFDPLGMAGASAEPDPTGDVSCGHLPSGDGWDAFDVREDFERFAFGVEASAPAGAVVATADDLSRFAFALSQPARDAPAWAVHLREAVVLHAGPTGRRPAERYAAGLDVTQSGDEIVLRHAGNTGDFFAELVWVPSRGVAAIVLVSTGIPMAATMAAALTRIGVDPHRE